MKRCIVPLMIALCAGLAGAEQVHTHHFAAQSFNDGWKFARYGLQPDGDSIPEPGVFRSSPMEVVASSVEKDATGPEKIFDGDNATRWCASNAKYPQSLIVRIKKPVTVSAVKFAFEFKPQDYLYTLEGETDKGQKVTVARREKAEDPAVSEIRLPAATTFRNLTFTFTGAVKSGAYASLRELTLLDPGGKRIENPETVVVTTTPEKVNFDDSSWRKLDIPHDWGIEGPFRIDLNGNTGKLPWAAIGWYRKDFSLPASAAGKQIYLDFDGAMANAQIYCNGEYVGEWPYGYASFRMDLTPFLKPGAKNNVAVRLDTEKWGSRWYPGAGLYRNTWLVTVDPVHVAQWGTYITTPVASDKEADVNLELTVDNKSAADRAVTAKTVIYTIDKDNAIGRKAGEFADKTFTVAKGEQAVENFSLKLKNPKLWDLDSPNRYVARTTLTVNGKVTDTYDTVFGVRTVSWDRNGIYINGRKTFIKGVCQHHDLGALGAAMNRRALERQFEILREMGCNAIRTSHNPPAPEVMDLADRMGMFIQVESFDCWGSSKSANDYGRLYWKWHTADLGAIVRHYRNNPSAMMWSIGNEVHEQGDTKMTRDLCDTVRKYDKTRPISNGLNNSTWARDSGAALITDAVGINYQFHLQPKYDKDPRYANFPTLGTETSSSISSRGEYFFDGKQEGGYQITSYDTKAVPWGCIPDHQFRVNAKYPYSWGEFVWTGFDYIGEPTPYNSDATNLLNFRNDPAKKAELEAELKKLEETRSPSRSSYFGIVDLAGFKKDRFYSYQAYWLPEKPMAHIFPHWNWPERVGKKVPVMVYSSGDEAELFVNGASQGKRVKRPNEDFRFRWDDVIYTPGTVKVVVTKAGKAWAEQTIATTGEADRLMVEADRATLNAADKNDLSFITVRVADAKGVTVPRTHNDIRFRIEGEGEIVAVDNGNAISFEPFQADTRKAYNGLALVIVKARPGAKQFTLHAESTGLKAASVKIGNK